MPIVIGGAQAALDASRLLEDEGFLVVAIRPPTVPEGTARLRLTFSAAHPDAEVDAARQRRAQPYPGEPMSAIFITATGTDVGKTFVAAGLIRHWRAAGRQVEALKPVTTGFDPAEAEGSDAGLLLKALGKPVSLAEIERICPWRYAAPLSPDVATRRENRRLPFDELVAFSQRAIATNSDTLLIEGVGGAMVPLDDSHTVLDWMAALGVPLLVVTGTYLGTLSHTLTCLDVLERRKLAIKALVVNETPGSSVTLADTMTTLSRFLPSIPMVGLTRAADAAAFKTIADLI